MSTLVNETIRNATPGPALAAEMLMRAERLEGVGEYLNEALALLLPACGADFAAVTIAGSGSQSIGQAGIQQPWPAELVAECLDRETTHADGPWIAVPLSPRDPSGDVLVVHRAAGSNPGAARNGCTPAGLEPLAAALGAGLRIIRARTRLRQRATQAETILSIVQQWGRTQEMETLLNQMAEASTKLLDADRASIFLWDKTNHLLVGRPALGVPGGELRIPDDAGVVGEVLRTGEPRRVSLREVRDPVNRRVDAQLGYQTRTLVAVPMRTAAGELLGVFEVINKRVGEFTADDEVALIELASHAVVGAGECARSGTVVGFAQADGRSSGRRRAVGREQPGD